VIPRRPQIVRQTNNNGQTHSPLSGPQRAPNTPLNLRVRRATIRQPPALGTQRFNPALRTTDSVVSIPPPPKIPIPPPAPPAKN